MSIEKCLIRAIAGKGYHVINNLDLGYLRAPNEPNPFPGTLGCSRFTRLYIRARGRALHLINHFLVCAYNDPGFVKPTVPCGRDSCELVFINETQRNKHIASTHDFVPQQCAKIDECGVIIFFDSRQRLGNRRRYQVDFVPSQGIISAYGVDSSTSLLSTG